MSRAAASFTTAEFRHPADGWYQVEPKGEHPNRAAGLVLVIDDVAAQSIVNRFNADAQAGRLRHGRELLVDHEHFSDQPDKETRAYGWLTQLANRADGIYGRIRWTATGREAVDGGDYRFFSTEYAPGDLKVVSNRHTRPLRLDGLTLTNMHNNRGQRPITNRAVAEQDNSVVGKEVAALLDLYQVSEKQRRHLAPVLARMGSDQRREFLEDLGHQAGGKMVNRERAAADRLLNRARELQSADGLTFEAAWNLARREQMPELFQTNR
jgi:phage I-like protein